MNGRNKVTGILSTTTASSLKPSHREKWPRKTRHAQRMMGPAIGNDWCYAVYCGFTVAQEVSRTVGCCHGDTDLS